MVVSKHENPNSSKLIAEDRVLSEETIIALKKLEYDFQIGRLGLQGTLWGASAALFTIILMVFAPMVTKKDIVEGWQLVIIVALVVLAVVFYGAFVFNRALKISAQMNGKNVNAESPPAP